MNITSGSMRHCLLAGSTSLLISAAAQANILPVNVDQPSAKTVSSNGADPLAGHLSGQRLNSELQSSLLANMTSMEDSGKRYEITYPSLTQVGSLDSAAIAYPPSDEPTTPGGSLFQRIVLADSDQRIFPDMAIVAGLLLLVGGIGYAQHLAKKHREQPRRRPLYPA
ncbi:MAG TPA: hypothetical protein PLB97_04905 [Accumulibacter sp.]|nr:hypothetical protein [Accumulibacter sp.]